MKNNLNFIMIIFDMDSQTVNFMHQGKINLKTKLSYKCFKTKKDVYAFRPQSLEEFLELLNYTQISFEPSLPSPRFVIRQVSPLRGEDYDLAFDFLLSAFTRKFDENNDLKETFYNDCKKIEQNKIKDMLERFGAFDDELEWN